MLVGAFVSVLKNCCIQHGDRPEGVRVLSASRALGPLGHRCMLPAAPENHRFFAACWHSLNRQCGKCLP